MNNVVYILRMIVKLQTHRVYNAIIVGIDSKVRVKDGFKYFKMLATSCKLVRIYDFLIRKRNAWIFLSKKAHVCFEY